MLTATTTTVTVNATRLTHFVSQIPRCALMRTDSNARPSTGYYLSTATNSKIVVLGYLKLHGQALRLELMRAKSNGKTQKKKTENLWHSSIFHMYAACVAALRWSTILGTFDADRYPPMCAALHNVIETAYTWRCVCGWLECGTTGKCLIIIMTMQADTRDKTIYACARVYIFTHARLCAFNREWFLMCERERVSLSVYVCVCKCSTIDDQTVNSKKFSGHAVCRAVCNVVCDVSCVYECALCNV